jgi:hypothetical protein
MISVEITTVDNEWKCLGCPEVSVLKCDVEGNELAVLQGARECLRVTRPAVLLEWNAKNLKPYFCPPQSLLEFAIEEGFDIFALPNLSEIRSAIALQLHMQQTESFLLTPMESRDAEIDGISVSIEHWTKSFGSSVIPKPATIEKV